MTDQHGATAYAWDSLGRLTAVQRLGVKPTYYHYDINNRIVSIVDPSGRTIYNSYDDDGRLKYSIDVSGYNYYQYDAASGLLLSHHRLKPDATTAGATSYGYDSSRRLVQVPLVKLSI